MPATPSSTAAVSALGPEDGLLYGYWLRPGLLAQRIGLAELDEALATETGTVWLHFNLSNVRARRWLAQSERVPEEMKTALEERDDRPRIDRLDDGLFAVISDFDYQEPGEFGLLRTLWIHAGTRLMLTARAHAVRSTDSLRVWVCGGLHMRSGIELFIELLSVRSDLLERLVDEMTEQVNEIEDAILTGGGAEREHLARIRRRCVRLRRTFGPERTALQKLDRQRAGWIDEDAIEQWHDATETLAFLLDDQSELYERAKLLQEEIASRVAEDTNRNLYVLSVLSAVLLPMTLVTGIFGMNTAGLPFQSLPGGTWYAGGLCVAAIALAWWFLRRGGIGRGS